MSRKEKLSRRSFIERSVASVVGAGIGLSGASRTVGAAGQEEPAAPKDEKPRIREYRDLGRTGWKVSDIAFGNAGMQDTSTLEYAMERGINYVDTARQYYDMEKVVGQLFPAKRDKLFVTTKLMPELITTETTVEQVMQGIEECLERLNTDYIDSCLIHSVGEDPKLGNADKIKNANVHEAFALAKKQGKIRFWGASSHGPRMIEDFTWLIENTDIDMIMPGMNFMTKGLEPVLAKAKAKGIAVAAMKSMSAAKKIDYKMYAGEGRTVRQAVLKWMLAQSDIDTITITMRTIEDIDEYVSASGRPELSPEEKKALKGYGTLLDRDYCRPGCAGCMNACPYGVRIPDILRYRLYFNNYGREKYAMELYGKLPRARSALLCADCTGVCEMSCPHGLALRRKLIEAHGELTV
jgi:predicted aldo/keto reductase-like oxidoreductase